MDIILHNYSKTVNQYNKMYKVNQNLIKGNRDLQAKNSCLLKAFEKLKSLREYSRKNDSRQPHHTQSNNNVSNVAVICEASINMLNPSNTMIIYLIIQIII